MRRDIKEQELTSTQLFLLSYQTCQWWNAVFVQAERFFCALEKNHGGTPWDIENANCLFGAERTFLITAIFHAIEDLEKLDYEIQRSGDFSLMPVLESIEQIAPLYEIKNLRDMNEHSLDYLMEMGQKQDQFRTTIQNGDCSIPTTAAWTYVDGDAKIMALGRIKIDKLLLEMKAQFSLVQAKTKEIFEKELTR